MIENFTSKKFGLNELVAKDYEEGILKLVGRYDNYLNVDGDYVEG